MFEDWTSIKNNYNLSDLIPKPKYATQIRNTNARQAVNEDAIASATAACGMLEEKVLISVLVDIEHEKVILSHP